MRRQPPAEFFKEMAVSVATPRAAEVSPSVVEAGAPTVDIFEQLVTPPPVATLYKVKDSFKNRSLRYIDVDVFI